MLNLRFLSVSPSAVVMVVALASFAAAQGQTWIVDQNNGPGTNFTDLPPAVAAATDGDLLLIRTGFYNPFVTSKGLTLLGEGAVTIASGFTVPPPLAVVDVSGLPSGRSFVLNNVAVGTLLPTTTLINFANCQGRVHLENVVALAPLAFTTGTNACSIGACAEVTITGGSLSGYPAVVVTQSSIVALSGVQVVGGNHCGSIRCSEVGEGVFAMNSTVLLSRCSVKGGSASLGNPFSAPKPAINMVNGSLLVTGDSQTTVQAGSLAGSPPLAAIVTSGGTLHLDTSIVVLGSQGGPDVSGTATVVRRRIVSLQASGGGLGGLLSAELVSPAGDPFVLAASLPVDPIALAPGIVFLDPVLLVPLVFGTQSAAERFVYSLTIPNNPSLRGAALALQASSLSVASQTVEFSNPAVIVVD